MSSPPDSDPNDFYYLATAYLRVASIAIAGYSFIETAPSVWKFYRDQLRSGRVTTSLVMLILIQFSSIMVLVISNFGFFYSHFTIESCRHYYLLPSVFKVLQAMVSQMILGIRAFNLSTRSRRIGMILIFLYVSTCTMEWLPTLYRRIPTVDEHGNCRGKFDSKSVPLNAWVYYVAAIVYDVGVTVISVGYLLKHKHTSISHTMLSRITRMMLYDGIGYFVFLTGVNVVNLMIYRSNSEMQTAGASLGYAATWIFTQRLLIHLHEMSLDRRNESMYEAYTISQTISSARAVNRAIRSQFEPKGNFADTLELTNPDFDLDTVEAGLASDFSDDVTSVQVHVEKTVTIHRRPSTKKELEDYSRHAVSAVTNAITDHTRTISMVSTGKKR